MMASTGAMESLDVLTIGESRALLVAEEFGLLAQVQLFS